jgi:hypothetical protein
MSKIIFELNEAATMDFFYSFQMANPNLNMSEEQPEDYRSYDIPEETTRPMDLSMCVPPIVYEII